MKRIPAWSATAVLDGAAVMPVVSASARAEMPVFELAVISREAIMPVLMNFRISMLPIDPVPINP
jgi:hypothetical protein